MTKNIVKRYKGFWFYGLSGSGKTFASNFLRKKIQNSFVIDGDYIRRVISKDLSYSLKDRAYQIDRMHSLALLAINNKTFPLVSTVFMNKKVIKNAKKNKILIIKIVRLDMESIKEVDKTYKINKDVIGKHIFLPPIKTNEIINTGDKKFKDELNKFL